MNLTITEINVILRITRSIQRKYPKKIEMGFHGFTPNTELKIIEIYVSDFTIYSCPVFMKYRDLARRLHGNYFKKKGIRVLFVCRDKKWGLPSV